MFSSKKFGVWCVVAALVAMCVGLMAGTAVVSAQEVTPPSFIQMPTAPPTVVVQPPMFVQMPVTSPPVTPPAAVVQPPVLPSPVVPPTAFVLPPVLPDFQLYQQYLARLLQINAEIAVLTARISIYEAVAAADPDDPFIQYDLQIMWGQLFMLQIEQTEVRLVLTTLNP